MENQDNGAVLAEVECIPALSERDTGPNGGGAGRRLEKTRAKGWLEGELFDWLQTIVSSLILVSLLFSLVARVIGVVGSSMEPTLVAGQKVLISSLFYTPRPGDVVVFNEKNIHEALPNIGPDDEPLVKRIIGVQGQKVEIDATGAVWVDGVPLDEPYIKERILPAGETRTYIVEPGHVFVMGDNRNHSSDSRVFGSVDARYILGRVLLRVWPLDVFGSLDVRDEDS